MTPSTVVDPFKLAADILDPPEWEPKDRKPLESCLRGPSGLLTIDPEVKMKVRPGGTHVVWPNGSEALVLGTPTPREVERLRAGGNRDIDWWEEMAANPQLADAWDQAAFGLRLGEHPHAIATTTPRSTEAYRKIRETEGTVVTKGSMFDNMDNLSKNFIARMKKKYEGTRLGRQELHGELLEDVVGALWSRVRIEETRVQGTPDLSIIVTAVDPAATSTDSADDTGIITAGLGIDGHGYVFGDDTVHDEPTVWGQRAVGALKKYGGDYIVGEVNNGGDMVKHVIMTTDAAVHFESVRASRGKATRAQPIAALWGNESQEALCHIVASLPELEDQLVTWVPGEEDSPDRLDAMVWALTELLLSEQDFEQISEEYEPMRIGADI
jgi:phage terminase large subunit-like protein